MWNEGCDSRSDASLRVAPVLPLVEPTALKLEVESFSSLSHLATCFHIYLIKTIKHNYFHPFILAGPFKGHWKKSFILLVYIHSHLTTVCIFPCIKRALSFLMILKCVLL